MKTLFTACTAVLCIGVSLLFSARAHAHVPAPTMCAAAPFPVKVVQPDGRVLEVVARGNAAVHYTETSDGYTLLANSRGVYEYALPAADGSLKLSGVKARGPQERGRRQRAFVASLTKHLRHSPEADATRRAAFDAAARGGETGHTTAGRFPSSGTRKALVLLIQYPDLPNEYAATDIEALMNEPGYNGTGSFRDFILKNSFGHLDIQTDVSGWYTAQHSYTHYGHNQGFQRSRQLMAEAIDAAEADGVDFSQYDNDGDGFVDAVIAIHAGPGAEVGAQLQYIWSHRWTMGNLVRQYDGVFINDYIINPETRPWGMVGVGVIAHEFGHALGLPDLYDTDNSSRGIGNFGLMGNGAWLNSEQQPANFNAWCKAHMTWIEPEVIESGAFMLEPADNHARCYRINTANPQQYFLLENRQPTGNDAYLPGHGLAIWHIDDSRTAMYPVSNGVNADETHKGVDLEEADGLGQLDIGFTNGDAGDLFPGTSGKTEFTAFSAPSSNLYGGAESGISITNIYEDGDRVHFRLNDPAVCAIVSVIAGSTANCGGGVYDQELVIVHEFAPESGFLQVNGRAFPVAASPQRVWLTGLAANGAAHGVTASFTELTGCHFEAPQVFTAPTAHEVYVEETTCDPALAGSFTFAGTSASGCDSVVHLTRHLLPSYEVTLTQSTCVADDAGTEVFNFTAASGCDSTVTVVTEFEPVATVYLEATTCDPAEAGVETYHHQTAGGCDSLVVVETRLLERPVTHLTEYVCGDAPAGTREYTYPAASGCDSTVIITAVPAPVWEIEVHETTCQADLAGSETFLFSTEQGCDSLVTVHREYRPFSVDFSWQADGNGGLAFTNTSVGAENFVWVMSDGTVYGSTDVSHEFQAPGTYWAFLFALGESCRDMDIQSALITVGDHTAPEAEEPASQPLTGDAATMRVYPNPSFGPVQVETPGMDEGPAVVSLFDAHGRLVLTDHMPSPGQSAASYDFSGVGPGLYTLRVSGNGESVSGQLMLVN